MDSLYQIVNGLVGNIDWGESLTVVACEFPGPNTFFKPKKSKLKLVKKVKKEPRKARFSWDIGLPLG